MAKHYVFDIEVFKYGWLVVLKDVETGEYIDFKCSDDQDDPSIKEWIKGALLCGFNNKHYDDYILKAIYYGFTIAEVKELNDFIIGGGQGWEWPRWNYHRAVFETYDTRDDLPITLSLKEIEGNMGLSIVESPVPFDLDRPLTDEEWAQTIKYCRFDVDATDKLRLKRQAYLKSKIYVGKLAALTEAQAMGMTNAKLTAAYLSGTGSKPKYWGDDIEYKRPKNLKVQNREVRSFFKDIDPTYERNAVVNIAGVDHTLAYGGLHGARPNYIGVSTDDRKLVNVDVTSYYPSLMIKNGYVSRAVPSPSDFEKVYTERVEAKKSGNKEKNEALKLVLNTTYGTMKNQYNALYDPLMANSVCISGQLYLIDLIEKLEAIPGLSLVQSNTDGILIEYDQDHDQTVKETVHEWEMRTGFEMEFDNVDRIFQKDVNNYVMLTADDKIKVKGGYVSNYQSGDYRNASLTIVAKAIVDYLLYGVPVEDTINQAESLLEFQIIAKTGRTYDGTVQEINGELIEVQRVNRVYASPDVTKGTIYKIKKEENRKDKIANLPDHCLIDNDNRASLADIDKSFYIDMAKKRIADFIGDQPLPKPKKQEDKQENGTDDDVEVDPRDTTRIRYFYHPESQSYWVLDIGETMGNSIDEELSFPVSKKVYGLGVKTGKSPYELEEKKKEEPPMAEAKQKPVASDIPTTPKSFIEKMFELRKELSSYVWEKDGKNLAQKYKYISEAQYKKYFEKALETIGLDYFTDVKEVDFIQNITDKMHLTTVKVEYTIVDPVSGEGRTYQSFGQGSDMGDKGVYKAMTGSLKYFIANNFLIAENNDPENDEEDTKPKSNRPVAPEKRDLIKQELMANDEMATEDQKNLIKTYRDTIKAAGGHDDVVKRINTTMKSKPTKVQAGALIMDLEELVEELDNASA